MPTYYALSTVPELLRTYHLYADCAVLGRSHKPVIPAHAAQAEIAICTACRIRALHQVLHPEWFARS